MADSINLTPKIVFFVILFFGLYVFITDKASKPSFKAYVYQMLTPMLGNSSNHTMITVLNDYTHTFSTLFSSFTVTMLGNLPVSYLKIKT